MARPTTRWLRQLPLLLPLLLSLLYNTCVGSQLSLGGADSFLPEHLGVAPEVTTVGKALEVTPLVDASGTNAAAAAVTDLHAVDAAANASDSNLPGTSEADNSLISTETDSPPELIYLPDFDEYTVDETQTTTGNLSYPENHANNTEEGYTTGPSAPKKQSNEKLATDAPDLTRRIVFTGEEANPTSSQPADQVTRPPSVVRNLDNPSTDFWFPNWPTQLLSNSEEASRRPTVRFPSGPPSAASEIASASLATPTQSYTVTKVPVTQYYFDLASVSPSDIPGPLFDLEDLGVSASALPSTIDDLTQPLDPEHLPSSISDLQSSVLVSSEEQPVTSTPTLPHSVTSTVLITEGPHSISASTVTQLSPPSSSLNNTESDHLVENTLHEDAENGDTLKKEFTETPEEQITAVLNQTDFEESEHNENITITYDSTPDTAEIPELTTTLQPTTPTPAWPTTPTDSELVYNKSSVTTPGSVKSSSLRTSQAAKTSRIPLWQLLSQSSPSRPLNTQPSSTSLTSSVTLATSFASDTVTPLPSDSPQSQSIFTDPPLALDDSSVPISLTHTLSTISTTELSHSVDSDPFTPLDSNDPDQVLTTKHESELKNASFELIDFNITNTDSTAAFSFVEDHDLVMHTNPPQNNTIHSSNDETNSTSIYPIISMANETNLHNSFNGTQTNIFSGDNTTNNNTNENHISNVTKVVENDLLVTSVDKEQDSVVDPTEVLVTSPPTISDTWTPVINTEEGHTESITLPASTSVLTSTTVVSPSPPDILFGFTPVTTSTQTPQLQSEVSGGSLITPSFASSATVGTSSTATAPAQDLSSLPAPTPTLSAALDTPAVEKTDSESPDNATTILKTTNISVKTKTDILQVHNITAEHKTYNEVTTVASWAPSVTESIHTAPPPTYIDPDLKSIFGDLPENTTSLATENPPPSQIMSSPNISHNPLETSAPPQTLHSIDTNLSSFPPISSSILITSTTEIIDELPITYPPRMPHDAPKSLASVFYQSVPEATGPPVTPDTHTSSAIPVPLDHPLSSISPNIPSLVEAPVPSILPEITRASPVPTSTDVPIASVPPANPEVPVSSTVPITHDVPEFSTTTDVQASPIAPTEVQESSVTWIPSIVSILPDVPISLSSVAILPTPSVRPTSYSPTLVVPTATDEPMTTLPPQPEQPEEGGEDETIEEVPEEESALEEVTEVPQPPPTTIQSTPIPETTTPTADIPTHTTVNATITSTPYSITSPEPEQEKSNATTFFPPMLDTSVNGSTAEPGVMPTLTTTIVLENGTEVVVALPFIRALVDYSEREFCQHKQNFRSMFAEWITRDLNGSVQVAATDIKFFSMAECPDASWLANNLTSNMENDKKLSTKKQEESHTHIYFYVSSNGEADPRLTEQFPLFPTDLAISKKLMYLLPRVMQLEMVRPDESSTQDQLQEAAVGTSVIVIIVVCCIVGVTILFLLFFFMVIKRNGAANNYYGRRCTPVSMDAYSMDSVSVYHSFRRKSKRRASGRSLKSYLNQAFDDPTGPSRPLNFAKLTHFISDIDGVYEEFGTIPVNMPKYDELPPGVEDKNRYANVIPVPETRVLLKVTKDGRNCEYINANFVRGARNESKYYIATQAPLDDTVADFWRMIWEQESRVVVMLTDFVEKGIDRCADYLPPSETLDCHRLYGDFQVTLKSRDMREKFVVSNVQLKNLENNLVREVAHMWFTGWPTTGVPNEEAGFISFILEVRRTRKKLRAKGPLVVHCSPGTGRTGTLLACDMVMKQFEEHRTIDVARTVYTIRRDRAGAVQTKEQYAFIYRVINLYASKLTSGNLESL